MTDLVNKFENTRIVLVEKTFFSHIQIINHSDVSKTWWYSQCVDSIHLVRNCTQADDLFNTDEKYLDLYVVLSGQFRNCLILKKDCKRLEKF